MERRLIVLALILMLPLLTAGRWVSSWHAPAENPETNGCESPDGVLIKPGKYRGAQSSKWQWNGCHRGVLIHLYIHEQPTTPSELIFFLDVANPAEGGSIFREGEYQRLNDQNFFRINESTNLGGRPYFLIMFYPEAKDNSGKGHFLVQPVAVPRRWRVRIVTTNDATWSYSVAYSMLK